MGAEGAERNTSFAGGARAELSAADVFWMNRIAGAEMRAMGVSARRTPRTAGGAARIAWSAVTSIGTAWYVARDLRRRTGRSPLGYLRRWISPPRARS
jgi:hypothetical protein